MAFMFENEKAARQIFEGWQKRFGTTDEKEEISISIIRKLPNQNKHHYCILITSSLPDKESFRSDQILSMATRSMVMEPDSDVNLERFLDSYKHFGAFCLIPAVFSGVGEPKLLTELSIYKRSLTVKLAKNIDEHDIESIALRIRENVS